MFLKTDVQPSELTWILKILSGDFFEINFLQLTVWPMFEK